MSSPTQRETTAQAARRHGVKTPTMWRRYEIARVAGHVTLSDDDTVGGKLYLPQATWDLICRVTPAPGRPGRARLHSQSTAPTHDIASKSIDDASKRREIPNPEQRETTAQAASRHGMAIDSMWRRYEKARDRGLLTQSPEDIDANTVYLPPAIWDRIARDTQDPIQTPTNQSESPNIASSGAAGAQVVAETTRVVEIFNAEQRETTQQAAHRHQCKTASLYRRLERLKEQGLIVTSSDDYIANRLYLTRATWDKIVLLTKKIGRPRKS